jgi:hypothetical protein
MRRSVTRRSASPNRESEERGCVDSVSTERPASSSSPPRAPAIGARPFHRHRIARVEDVERAGGRSVPPRSLGDDLPWSMTATRSPECSASSVLGRDRTVFPRRFNSSTRSQAAGGSAGRGRSSARRGRGSQGLRQRAGDREGAGRGGFTTHVSLLLQEGSAWLLRVYP